MSQSTPTRDVWEGDDDDRDVLTDLPGSGRAMLDYAITEARNSEVNRNVDSDAGLIFTPWEVPRRPGSFQAAIYACFAFIESRSSGPPDEVSL